ncbi:hypothetical protein JCM1840_006731 [Sporobolomyces johnsonii]
MPPTFPLLAIRALSDNTAGSTGLNSTTKVIIVVVIFAILSVFVAMGVGVLKTWKENRDLNSVEPPPAMSTNQTHLPTQSVVVGITIGVLILLVVALFIYISQTKLSRSSASCPPSRSAPDSGPPMILHPIPIYPNTAPPPSPSSSSFATLHRWDSTFKVGGPESSDGEREARDEHVNRGSGRAMGDAGGGIRTSPPPYALRTAPTRETV